MKKLSAGWVVVGALIIVGVYVGVTYNAFVQRSEGIEGQWAQVETQYQRRYDLIPNLVSSVQGTMKQEQAIFTALAEARTQYAGATTPRDRASAAAQVEGSLGRLIAVMENYPQLQSAQNVQTLMAQLEGTENRISVERGRYNESVRDYNASVRTFPSSVVAALFGFDEWAYFESAEGAENAPRVEL